MSDDVTTTQVDPCVGRARDEVLKFIQTLSASKATLVERLIPLIGLSSNNSAIRALPLTALLDHNNPNKVLMRTDPSGERLFDLLKKSDVTLSMSLTATSVSARTSCAYTYRDLPSTVQDILYSLPDGIPLLTALIRRWMRMYHPVGSFAYIMPHIRRLADLPNQKDAAIRMLVQIADTCVDVHFNEYGSRCCLDFGVPCCDAHKDYSKIDNLIRNISERRWREAKDTWHTGGFIKKLRRLRDTLYSIPTYLLCGRSGLGCEFGLSIRFLERCHSRTVATLVSTKVAAEGGLPNELVFMIRDYLCNPEEVADLLSGGAESGARSSQSLEKV